MFAAPAAASLETMDRLAKEGRFHEIVDRCGLAIRANPHDAEAYCMQGWAKSHLPQYQHGLDDLNKALQLRPAYTRAHKYRALEYIHLGQFEKSLADLDAAIRLQPRSDPELYYLRAWVHSNYLRDYKGALDDLNTVIHVNPKDADAYDERGWLYQKMVEPQKEIADYNTALSLSPDDGYIYIDRAHAYGRLKQYQKAKEDIDKAARLIPNEPSIFINLAWLRDLTGDRQQAVSDMRQALWARRKNSLNYVDFTSIHQLLSSYRRSFFDSDKVVNLLPQDWAGIFNRALARESLGEYQRAIDDLDAVMRLGGPAEEVYRQRAEIQRKRGAQSAR
ncbi:MAG TPA: hypothetical protein V6D17_16515 [Candidatus Obscuribacterales bacterium]